MPILGIWKTRKEKEQEAQKNLEERLGAEQIKIGEQIYSALTKAAQQNTQYKIMQDGKIAQGIGAMRVTTLPKNGGMYSILVGIDDQSSFTGWNPNSRGYPVLQVNVKMHNTGEEINAFKGPYGPEWNYSAKAVGPAIEDLCAKVKNYTLFPKSN